MVSQAGRKRVLERARAYLLDSSAGLRCCYCLSDRVEIIQSDAAIKTRCHNCEAVADYQLSQECMGKFT